MPVGFDVRDVCEASGSVEGVCEVGWNSGVKEDVGREVEFFLKSTMSAWGISPKQGKRRTNCWTLTWARTRFTIRRTVCGKNSCIFVIVVFSFFLAALDG